MNAQRQIAERLIKICFENDLFLDSRPDMEFDQIGDLNLVECPWFDSMALVFLQSEIEGEWGVHIPETQFVAWLRSLNQIAGHIAQRLSMPALQADPVAPVTKPEGIT